LARTAAVGAVASVQSAQVQVKPLGEWWRQSAIVGFFDDDDGGVCKKEKKKRTYQF
jgi:hypothetical protein